MFDISEPIVQLLGVGLTVSASASMSAESDSSSSALLTAAAAAALSAESDVTANGYAVLFGSSALSAQSSLSVTTKLVLAAASINVGSSDLEAESTRLQFATARIIDLEVVGGFTALVGHPVQARPLVASSALTATIYTNPRLLILPTVEYAYTDNVLLERYPIDNGQALLITNGVGELSDFTAQQLIADADYYFPGGRRVELNPTEEAAVVAAGYGEYIVTEFL